MVLQKKDYPEHWDKLVQVIRDSGYKIQNEDVTEMMFIKCNDKDLEILVQMAKES
jgi:hypothetical protein